MTTHTDDLQASIVAAVQRELNRFSDQVSAEVQRLRVEMASDRAARTDLEHRLSSLAPVVQDAAEGNAAFQSEIRRAIEERLTDFTTQTKRRHDEMDARIGRVVDEASIGLAASVEAAARPVIKQVEHRQDLLERELGTLDKNLRKFDDQAARLVTHFNEVTRSTEDKMNEVSAQLSGDVDQQLGGLATRLDEISAQSARQQSEVSNIVGARVDQAEDRINDRLLTAEARINEDLGRRVADIDVYVGRVSAGLDDAVVMLSDRIAAMDRRFEEFDRTVADVDARIAAVDVDAIDEMKDRVAGALGQAELLRIEMDRFQKTIGDSLDRTSLRLVELETALQDQALDVDTAVQLERLEEVERALIALDPAQFVRRSEVRTTTSPRGPAGAPVSSPNGASGASGANGTSSTSSTNGMVGLARASSTFSPPVNGLH